ncbi:MAG: hypothetical protein VX210_09930 [Myxococcota bacterium]|nr:hypothetical protein [Myxococcota bacterium]
MLAASLWLDAFTVLRHRVDVSLKQPKPLAARVETYGMRQWWLSVYLPPGKLPTTI